jgi:hypothetical protein
VAATSERALRSASPEEPGDGERVELVRRVLIGELSPEQACESAGVALAELTEWMRKHRRAARRAVEDRIAETLVAHGLEKDDFVLSGNLENMSLSDLLEGIQLGRKNAHLRLEYADQIGHLWCSDGEIIHAEVDQLVGGAAVYRLLSLEQGRFQVEFGSFTRDRTVLASTEALLLDYARRDDECRALRQQLGDLSRVFVASGDYTGIDAEQRGLLDAFDGVRSVEAVVAHYGRPELETLRAIEHLIGAQRLISGSDFSLTSTGVRTSPRRTIPPVFLHTAPETPEPEGAPESSVPPAALSFIRASLAPLLARPYVLPASVACAVLAAFCVGFWGARPAARPASASVPTPAPETALASVANALCGPGMALISGRALPHGDSVADGAAARPFCLAERTVSTEEYQACVNSRRCEPARAETEPYADDATGDSRCNGGQPGRERFPINCVTPHQAEQYCEWRGQRLPMPGEWELAWQTSHEAAGAPVPLFSGMHPGASGAGAVSEWTKASDVHPHRGVELDAPQQPYAVLRVSPSTGTSAATEHPSRLYMSASAHGRNIGFRCALSLETSAATE